MAKDRVDENYSDAEPNKRFEAALKSALNTPHKPLKDKPKEGDEEKQAEEEARLVTVNETFYRASARESLGGLSRYTCALVVTGPRHQRRCQARKRSPRCSI
jgi:hypothetical protein